MSIINRFVWSKVSVANSDNLTTRFDTKRRIIYISKSLKVTDLYHSQTIHSRFWILTTHQESKITRIIHKRNWNIRSSIISASLTQNNELQEYLETFTRMFRHIRSRISEKMKSQTSYLRFCFLTPTFCANCFISWRNLMSRPLIFLRTRVSRRRIQKSTARHTRSSWTRVHELQAKWRRPTLLAVHQTYDNWEHQRTASVYRYNYTMSNSFVKWTILFSCMSYPKCRNSKIRFLSYYCSRLCEGRHSRPYTLELENNQCRTCQCLFSQLSADENKPSTTRTSIHPTQEERWQHTWTAHVQLSNDT